MVGSVGGAANVPKPKTRWTPAEKQRLKDAFLEGASPDEVAEELGRTRRSVEHMAQAMRVPRPHGHPVNGERRASIVHLLGRGFSLSDVARALKKNVGTIARSVWRMEEEGIIRRVGLSTSVRFIPCSDEEILCQRRENRSRAAS